MPVHDWTRVEAGTFHHFHTLWIGRLSDVLNGGLLPEGFYALAEQSAGDVSPDVLTLESANGGPPDWAANHPGGLSTVAERKPRVSLIEKAEKSIYAAKQRTLVIRHASGDRVVALIEIVSPGNKDSKAAFAAFLRKALSALRRSHHLLLIDLFPPGPRDRGGIHRAIWSRINGSRYRPPVDKPLTLAAYTGGPFPTAYVEPAAVGTPLPDMPLFLDPEWYIDVPLEETYMAAWRGVPERWRRVIESTADEPGAPPSV